VVEQASRQILCAAVGKGREHDFKLFKRSAVRLAQTTECSGDRGYQGLQKRHAKSRTPIKKPRGRERSKADKYRNRALASQRIVCEHVIGKLRVCKILAERYRNRRRRFGWRVHLLAALYNLDLLCSR
jgi:hypothetical protein